MQNCGTFEHAQQIALNKVVMHQLTELMKKSLERSSGSKQAFQIVGCRSDDTLSCAEKAAG
jgi:hypothetical protein